MNNTSSQEDRICDQCRAFGGLASDCVDIVERLDKEINKLEDRVDELEAELKERD